jgi:hypothetical protein
VCPRTGLDDVERRYILSLPGLELPSGTLSPEVKRQGHEDDHSQKLTTPLHVFMAGDALRYLQPFLTEELIWKATSMFGNKKQSKLNDYTFITRFNIIMNWCVYTFQRQYEL